MCDFLSWGVPLLETRRARPELPKILVLEDDMRKTLVEKGMDEASTIGHYAIARYYHLPPDDFEHYEGWQEIPHDLVKQANAGAFDGAAKISSSSRSKHRYFSSGNTKSIADHTMKKEVWALEITPWLDRYLDKIELSRDDKHKFRKAVGYRVQYSSAPCDFNQLGNWGLIFGSEHLPIACAFWYYLTGKKYGGFPSTMQVEPDPELAELGEVRYKDNSAHDIKEKEVLVQVNV